MKPSEIKEVLDFWFGPLLEGGRPDSARSRLWFGKNPRIDDDMCNRFESLVLSEACQPLLRTENAHAILARIIVLDQFPRNIYRKTAKAYAFDHLALSQALDAIDRGIDQRLPEIPRAFVYLPLEHAEDTDLQDRSVLLFRDMARQAPAELQVHCASFLNYAERHRDIITRFGRFPHRNAMLGRTSTPEEMEFLKQSGSGF